MVEARGEGGRFRPRSMVLGAAVGLVLWGLACMAAATPQGRALEDMALDAAWLLRVREAARPADLLVVAVDEPSLQEIGLPWPWPRRLHARLLDRLRQAGARAVVLDMVFAEPSAAADDDAFAQALAAGGNTVLAAALEIVDDPAFSRQVRIDPLPRFARAAAGLGLAVLTPDPDGTVRRYAARHAGLPTLAGAAAALVSGGAVPDAAGLIDYPGPPRTIDTVSYADVIDADHPLPAARIKGRIVVVGRAMAASAAPLGQADTFSTPFTRTTGQPAFGPEIHAAILATLLGGGPGREVPVGTTLLRLGVLLPLAGAVLFCLRPPLAAGVALAMAGGLSGLSAGLFVWRFFWLPPALASAGLLACGAAATLYRGLVESREKRFLARAFSRYLSPVVVRDLVRRPERLELGGEEAVATVLFSDLAGFTTFSESLSPKDLIGVLNDWFTPATDIILGSGGTLDKFIGDAVMAFWGAPLPDDDQAAKALGAALAMDAAMRDLSGRFAARGLPSLRARMGLHRGPAVVGNVGSRERFNYTILGDTVNLASRLESLNKQYGTAILATAAVCDAAGDAFPRREIDVVRVKGRSAAVAVFEPLGPAGTPAPGWAATFAAARAAYGERRFGDALAGFLATDAARGGDAPSVIFAGRCRRYLADPPPDDWDGVFVPTEK